jgi:Flp pilus assembly pilin Flp
MMRQFECLRSFWQEENGQDLIEYSLLITFVAIACAAVVGTAGSATSPIWSGANTDLSKANTAAS